MDDNHWANLLYTMIMDNIGVINTQEFSIPNERYSQSIIKKVKRKLESEKYSVKYICNDLLYDIEGVEYSEDKWNNELIQGKLVIVCPVSQGGNIIVGPVSHGGSITFTSYGTTIENIW